ncbi:transcription initiation factor TFIID subunit 4-like [Mustela erminea]|uniref:transcription initiation factor TFIID subunit 4-like n=1 Tax=Mustela erminea TaxID=36723 RepID=UPI001386D563|nr:transcription initiation factor TFIID subunit 4-like [Mustela erminea]
MAPPAPGPSAAPTSAPPGPPRAAGPAARPARCRLLRPPPLTREPPRAAATTAAGERTRRAPRAAGRPAYSCRPPADLSPRDSPSGGRFRVPGRPPEARVPRGPLGSAVQPTPITHARARFPRGARVQPTPGAAVPGPGSCGGGRAPGLPGGAAGAHRGARGQNPAVLLLCGPGRERVRRSQGPSTLLPVRGTATSAGAAEGVRERGWLQGPRGAARCLGLSRRLGPLGAFPAPHTLVRLAFPPRRPHSRPRGLNHWERVSRQRFSRSHCAWQTCLLSPARELQPPQGTESHRAPLTPGLSCLALLPRLRSPQSQAGPHPAPVFAVREGVRRATGNGDQLQPQNHKGGCGLYGTAVSRSPKASTQPSLGKELQRPGNAEVLTPVPLLQTEFWPSSKSAHVQRSVGKQGPRPHHQTGVLLLVHLEADAGESGPRIPRESCRTSPVCPWVRTGQKRSASQPEMKAEFMAVRERGFQESLGDSGKEGVSSLGPGVFMGMVVCCKLSQTSRGLSWVSYLLEPGSWH